MKINSFEVDINPEVLKWALNNSGWTNEQIATKLQITSESLNAWLTNTKKPTITQLENLAQILKRPLAAFFLSEPPKEDPLPKDYRMLPDKVNKFENKTLLAIRRARRLQRVSKELSENLQTEMDIEINSENTSTNPRDVALKYIQILKVDDETRKKWKTAYNAFSYLRDSLEDRNILVFKMGMPIEDARGFCLVEEKPPVIVVNSKDTPEAQVFTLLHEFGHVLLNKSGVSMAENLIFRNEINLVEKWCNEFSSAFLLPLEIVNMIVTHYKNRLTETATLNSLSNKFKISKAMLLYRLYNLGYINSSEYKSTLSRYDPTKQLPKPKKKGGGAISADKKCLNERGQKFVSLVSKNVDRGYITRSDALDYLAIKSKHLDNIMAKAKK